MRGPVRIGYRGSGWRYNTNVRTRLPPLPLRPPRWSSNLLCGLTGGSLLIFLLAMGIWVRSYYIGERLSLILFPDQLAETPPLSPGTLYTLRCSKGAAMVSVW